MAMRPSRSPFIIKKTSVFTGVGNYAMGNEVAAIIKKAVGAATTVTLPPSPQIGQIAIVKDGKGDAQTNNITVQGAASATIDGAATDVIASNFGAAWYQWNGTEWGLVCIQETSPTGDERVTGNLTVTGSATITGTLAAAGPINESIGASTAALGTNSGNAAVLPAGTATVYPTTAADGTVGVRINAADQVTGRTLSIGNGVAAQVLKVYPPTGGTINGAAADAAYSSASGKGVLITCLSGAGNTWLAMG